MNSSRLERWLGAETVKHLSNSMMGWYGPPIAVAGVPGEVYVHGDGNFSRKIRSGRFASAIDCFQSFGKRLLKRMKAVVLQKDVVLGAGFASISAMIAAETAGKGQRLFFNKIGATGVVAVTNTLWYVGNQPVAGAAAGAAPGGTVPTSATAGALE
jgi:hypothetical protein